MTYGPEERALLETQCLEFYDELVTAGVLEDDDPRIADDAPLRPAFDLLVELGHRGSGAWAEIGRAHV